MTTLAGETTLLQTLERALASTVGRTPNATTVERLVCVTVPAPLLDPVAIFEAAEAVGNRALWEQPAEQVSLVAAGAAKEVTASGPDRIQQLTAAWRELTDGAITNSVEECPLAAPIALSGMAFQPVDKRSAAWQSYPDALFTVPRFLFISYQGASWLAASIIVGPSEDGQLVVRSTLDELSALLLRADRPMSDQPPALTVAEEDDSTLWMQTVAVVEEEIRSGTVEKLVLAREVRAHAEEPLAWGAALRRLRDRYGAGTTFAFARDHSCFIGSSPERLIRLQGRTVQANCVAGSAPRDTNEEEDRSLGHALLHDNKELHEHALVVDAYRSALQPYCVALDIPDKPGLLTMPNVQHLDTPVEGTLHDNQHVLDLVARLHPTPAVGGVPQEAACSLIQAYEPFDRGWYAGPVGWFDSRGDGEFVVAIRSALLQGQDALLYAGCGIVKGSDPEREYSESQLKLEPMLWAMNGMDG